MSDERVKHLLDSIDIPTGGKLVVAVAMPDRTWALGADLPSVPPRKGRWEFAVENVTLDEAVARYSKWLASKRAQGQVP